MYSKFLVKMNNAERGLERVMEAVRESRGQVKNMSAHLSLDESLFFLTMEVATDKNPRDVQNRLTALEHVKAVEVEAAA